MTFGSFDRLCIRMGRASLLLLLAAAPFLIVEGLARMLHDPAPIRRVWDPFAYRIPQPLLAEEFEGPEGDRVSIRLNELGMRGPSIAEPVEPGTMTLVFLGGSTTENYALPREATFPELVGAKIADRLGRPVRVFNAGMSSATTSTSLARLQHQVLDLEPSLVVVMHAINDFMSGYHPGYRKDGRYLRRPAEAGRRPRSYFVDWVRKRPRRGWVEADERVERRDLPSLPVFQRNLRSMVAVAAAHEIPILLLTQAHRYRGDLSPGEQMHMGFALHMGNLTTEPPDFPSLTWGMDQFNAAVLEASGMEPAFGFDSASRLPRTPEMIYDDCHLTRAGNLRLSEILVPEIEFLLTSVP